MTDTTKGKLRAFLNGEKTKGDTKPTFEGTLTLPGSAEERSVALWARSRKQDGSLMLTGRVAGPKGSAVEQITGLTGEKAAELKIGDGNLTLKPGEIVLFQNTAKSEADASKDKRPDFYGWHHSGEPTRGAVSVGVWAKTDTNGRAYLTGNLNDAERQQVQAADQEPEQAA